jgi:hypothetical protein
LGYGQSFFPTRRRRGAPAAGPAPGDLTDVDVDVDVEKMVRMFISKKKAEELSRVMREALGA